MTEVMEIMKDGEYLPVAELSPEVAAALEEERGRARALIESRRDQLESGRTEQVPVAVDALSTADSVIEARDKYGEDSAEYRERRQALFMDSLRLVKEWNHKLKPEYFSPLRHHYSQPEEEFYSHGLAIGQMTLNALRPIPQSPEQEDRRVNERVEDRTPIIVQKVGGFALGAAGIRTISMITDKSLNDFENDQKNGTYTGYDGEVPEVEKHMIRDIRIDPITGDRLQDQIAIIGKHSINEYVIKEALRRRGVDASQLDKTGLHGLQLLVGDDLKEFAKLLDQVASEEWCTPIFMGERVDEDHPMDYDAFWEEAEQREEDLSDLAETVSNFVLGLAEDGFDRRKAPGHVQEWVKRLLLNEAKKDIAIAHNAFGEETAQGILDVQRLEAEKRFDEAFRRMEEVIENAPDDGYCSGGSCGLEGVNRNSEEGKELAKKLKAEDGDEIVKDKERKCKCGAKAIVYAYNKNKVNKLCEACGAFESKSTK